MVRTASASCLVFASAFSLSVYSAFSFISFSFCLSSCAANNLARTASMCTVRPRGCPPCPRWCSTSAGSPGACLGWRSPAAASPGANGSLVCPAAWALLRLKPPLRALGSGSGSSLAADKRHVKSLTEWGAGEGLGLSFGKGRGAPSQRTTRARSAKSRVVPLPPKA